MTSDVLTKWTVLLLFVFFIHAVESTGRATSSETQRVLNKIGGKLILSIQSPDDSSSMLSTSFSNQRLHQRCLELAGAYSGALAGYGALAGAMAAAAARARSSRSGAASAGSGSASKYITDTTYYYFRRSPSNGRRMLRSSSRSAGRRSVKRSKTKTRSLASSPRSRKRSLSPSRNRRSPGKNSPRKTKSPKPQKPPKQTEDDDEDDGNDEEEERGDDESNERSQFQRSNFGSSSPEIPRKAPPQFPRRAPTPRSDQANPSFSANDANEALQRFVEQSRQSSPGRPNIPETQSWYREFRQPFTQIPNPSLRNPTGPQALPPSTFDSMSSSPFRLISPPPEQTPFRSQPGRRENNFVMTEPQGPIVHQSFDSGRPEERIIPYNEFSKMFLNPESSDIANFIPSSSPRGGQLLRPARF